jgi:hypothetical protein
VKVILQDEYANHFSAVHFLRNELKYNGCFFFSSVLNSKVQLKNCSIILQIILKIPEYQYA